MLRGSDVRDPSRSLCVTPNSGNFPYLVDVDFALHGRWPRAGTPSRETRPGSAGVVEPLSGIGSSCDLAATRGRRFLNGKASRAWEQYHQPIGMTHGLGDCIPRPLAAVRPVRAASLLKG